MEPKSFAVGVRLQTSRTQSMINLALYGEEENEKLGAAAYKVTYTCENGRGVYSFCMCPGGYVVNASSEPGDACCKWYELSGQGQPQCKQCADRIGTGPIFRKRGLWAA